MKEAVYYHGNTVIMDYSKKYIKDREDLLSSEGFLLFLKTYLKELKEKH